MLTLENKLGGRNWWGGDSIRKLVERAPGIESRMERSILCGADTLSSDLTLLANLSAVHRASASILSGQWGSQGWAWPLGEASSKSILQDTVQRSCVILFSSAPPCPLVNNMAQTRPEKSSHFVTQIWLMLTFSDVPRRMQTGFQNILFSPEMLRELQLAKRSINTNPHPLGQTFSDVRHRLHT